jgi:transcription antitermination protein NusB
VSARSKARKRALDVLYEADIRGLSARVVLDQVTERRAAEEGVAPHELTVAIIDGVEGHRERIDELLQTYSHGWVISRMPAIDRNILRLAAFELLWGSDAPDAVVIDEAVSLTRELSTDESPAFVNGLLAQLVEVRPSLELGA